MDYRFDFGRGIGMSGWATRSDPHPAESIGYALNDLTISAITGRCLTERAADLIDVCIALGMADRFSPRERSPDQWHREIEVVIPVRNQSLWQSSEVQKVLKSLAGWVTDDKWHTQFVHRLADKRPSELQLSLPGTVVADSTITLNSGGLDSALGLLQSVVEPASSVIVPVTVGTSSRIRDTVSKVVDEIRIAETEGEPSILPVLVGLDFHPNSSVRYDKESSYRARALLFLATGAATAATAGLDRLQLTENGVGAIGLPMTPDQWGALTTRATHPKTLQLFSELVSLVFERDFTIHNTAVFLTKGQLARMYLDDRFLPAAKETVSCDRVTYETKPCGRCASCLQRQMALNSRGIHFTPGDLRPRGPDDSVAVAFQVEELRIAGEAGFPGLLNAFPDIRIAREALAQDPRQRKESEARIMNMYRQHIMEFDEYKIRVPALPLRLPADMAPDQEYRHLSLAG